MCVMDGFHIRNISVDEFKVIQKQMEELCWIEKETK